MIQHFLAALAPIMLLAIVYVLVWVDLPEGPVIHLLDVALGAVISQALTVYGFYFGSSHGSREKDKLIQKQGGHDDGA